VPVLSELPKPSDVLLRDSNPLLETTFTSVGSQIGEIEEADIFLDGEDPLARPEDFSICTTLDDM
jgi:hypothetical protein